MGRSPRARPARLAAKLLEIRRRLGLSQQRLLDRLDYHGSPLLAGHISEFERGLREPPLPLLLRYARLVGVSTDLLVDDEADLPEQSPEPELMT